MNKERLKKLLEDKKIQLLQGIYDTSGHDYPCSGLVMSDATCTGVICSSSSISSEKLCVTNCPSIGCSGAGCEYGCHGATCAWSGGSTTGQ